MSEGESRPAKRVPEPPASEAAAFDGVDVEDSGTKEAVLFNRGLSEEKIRQLAQTNEHNRSEAFKNHFERVAICSLWGVAIIALAVGGTWFWHLLLPDRWHWLNPDGVQKLQNIVTGGIIASLAAGHVRKRLGH